MVQPGAGRATRLSQDRANTPAEKHLIVREGADGCSRHPVPFLLYKYEECPMLPLEASVSRAVNDPFPANPVRVVGGVVLLREDNAALLQWRDNKPGLNAAGLWVFPGGHCEPGESLEAGARREFREETGYECGELIWVTTFLHPSDDGRLTYQLGMFVCRYDGIQVVHCFEGQAVEFIPRGDAGKHPMPEYVPRIWDMAIERLRGAS
jgi:8-oxo-dGTP pyrophosphatase MutT (NUDIX family)